MQIIANSRYTEADYTKALALYKTMSLKELRRRQDLTNQQIEMAFQQKNEDSLIHLQNTITILAQAVDFVAFK